MQTLLVCYFNNLKFIPQTSSLYFKLRHCEQACLYLFKSLAWFISKRALSYLFAGGENDFEI